LGNTGDGLKMAWRLGAGMADMGYISGTYGSHPDTGMEFHELLTAYYMGAIIVNERGQRFVDESKSYKILGRECLKQPDGLGFEIFDRRMRAKSHPVPLNDIEMLENIGHVFKAESLEELARVAGIDVEGLVNTVEHYNAALPVDVRLGVREFDRHRCHRCAGSSNAGTPHVRGARGDRPYGVCESARQSAGSGDTAAAWSRARRRDGLAQPPNAQGCPDPP
jgi:hypothetical protein